MFLETAADVGMFAPCVSILLEFHKRVQKKNVPCNVGRIGRSPVDMARIFLFPINYLKLGHYPESPKPTASKQETINVRGWQTSGILHPYDIVSGL